ncbi:MAG: tetratricopeptide repeat protein [Pirellulaceae bacterium]
MLALSARPDSGEPFFTGAFADDYDDQDTLATSLYEQQQWEQAARAWGELLERYPNDPRAINASFFRGEALLQLGQLAAALEQFETAEQRWPASRHAAQLAFRIGEIRYLDGDLPTAKSSLDRFLKENPEHGLCHFALTYRGEIALASSDWLSARRDFEQALQRNPAGVLAERCRFGMGRALEALGRLEEDADRSFEAQSLYDEAARFYEFVGFQGSTDLFDEALLNLAILKSRTGDAAGAAAALDRLLEPERAAPLAPRGWYLLGRMEADRGEPQHAIEAFRSGLKLTNHTDSVARAGLQFELASELAAEAIRQGDDMPVEAEQLWRLVSDSDPPSEFSAEATLRLLETHYERESWETVIALGRRSLERQPEQSAAWLVSEYVGRALLEQHDYAAAIEVLSSALPPAESGGWDWSRISSEQVAVPYLLGLSLLRSQQTTAAIDVLETLEQRDDTDSLRSGILVALVTAYDQLSAHDPTQDRLLCDHAQTFLTSYPASTEAANVRSALCQARARLEQWTEADEALREYLELHPDHVLVGATIGLMTEAARTHGEERWSDRWRTLLVEQTPAGPERWRGFLQLAETERRAGRQQEALEWWRRIVDQAPNDPSAAQAALQLGRHFDSQGDLAEAARMHQAARGKHATADTAAAAPIGLASLLVREPRLGDPSELIAPLEAIAATTDHPLADQALYQLGWIKRAADDHDGSAQAFETLVVEFPDSTYRRDAAYRLADHALRARDAQAARHWWQRIARPTPVSSSASQSTHEALVWRERIGLLDIQILAVEAKWSELAQASEQFATEFPESSWNGLARFWSAESQYRLGDFAASEQQFQSLWDDETQATASWLCMVSLRLGQVAALREDWDDALTWCETTRDRFPDFRQLHEVDYLLGRSRAARGEYSLAREAYERVIRSPIGGSTETAAMAQWMIGESYFHQQQYTDAIAAYQRVKTLYPFARWQAASLLQAAKCFELKQDQRQAITLYAQILRDYADTEYATEASSRLESLNGGGNMARRNTEAVDR